MLNKRKIIGHLIDIIILIILNTIIMEALLKIITFFLTNKDIWLHIIISIEIIIVSFYLLPGTIKNENTIGKKIAKIIIKDKNTKLRLKEIISIIIIISLLEIVLSKILGK